MAWLVTEPELLATGAAVALTPPTDSARTFVGDKKPIKHTPITGKKWKLCRLLTLLLFLFVLLFGFEDQVRCMFLYIERHLLE